MATINLFYDKIRNIVQDILGGNYEDIVLRKENGRIDINDLENVIKEYNKTIIPLPEEAFSIAELYKINDNQIDIYIPLWTKEEGRSDLTLFLSCYNTNETLTVEINDLRVL
jgi:hypothetical protein